MVGTLPSPPRNVPVPSVYHEQRSYSPILPAPASNKAARTASSASSGTKTTSLRFTFAPASGGEPRPHGHAAGPTPPDARGACWHPARDRGLGAAERLRSRDRGLGHAPPGVGVHAARGSRLRSRQQRRRPDPVRVRRADVVARLPAGAARCGDGHRLGAHPALRGAGRDREAGQAHLERPRRRAVPHPHVYISPTMGVSFERAREFVYTAGRVLERRLFARLYEGGAHTGVVAAVLAYRNDDGGFGHGLEPDKLVPDSQPLDVQVALERLHTAGAREL